MQKQLTVNSSMSVCRFSFYKTTLLKKSAGKHARKKNNHLTSFQEEQAKCSCEHKSQTLAAPPSAVGQDQEGWTVSRTTSEECGEGERRLRLNQPGLDKERRWG